MSQSSVLADQVIDFEDANLKRAVIEALDKEEGPVYLHQVEKIESLTAIEAGIKDLSGIEYLVNLRYLNLYDNEIESIAELASLEKLEELVFEHNYISDISALSNLNNLEIFNFRYNQIDDLRPLDNLSKLRVIRLWGNQVETTAG